MPVMEKRRNQILVVCVVVVFIFGLNHVIGTRRANTKVHYGADDTMLAFKPVFNSIKEDMNFSFDSFYSMDFIKNPQQANSLSKRLTTRQDMINEAQRLHLDIFGAILGKYKYAMLFDFSPSENKGDSAIVVGELTLLRKLKIELIFACPTGKCVGETLNRAVSLSKQYSDKDLVILFHGGGNVIGYHAEDKRRFKEIEQFKNFHIVMFPQSIFYRGPKDHIEMCQKVYASHNRLTFVWRDRVSFEMGKQLFPKVQSLMSPDIAFQIGHVPRFMSPLYDVMWIQRADAETPGYAKPNAPDGLSMVVGDWLFKWVTSKGASPMEDAFLMTTNGLTFLQRGRIVVTDRLHGHILATLLDIPHIYIDNAQSKISNYHNTWTASVENIIRAKSSADALHQAQILLSKLDDKLPKKVSRPSNK